MTEEDLIYFLEIKAYRDNMRYLQNLKGADIFLDNLFKSLVIKDCYYIDSVYYCLNNIIYLQYVKNAYLSRAYIKYDKIYQVLEAYKINNFDINKLLTEKLLIFLKVNRINIIHSNYGTFPMLTMDDLWKKLEDSNFGKISL